MRIHDITFVQRKRKFKLGTFLMVIVIALLIIVLGFVAYLSYVGWSLVHPGREFFVVSSATAPVGYKNVSFKDSTGSITLKGWYFASPGSKKTVILCHGYKENRLEFKPAMIKEFIKAGYNVLTFDFRNCGKSEGSTTSVGYYEKYDLLGAINFIKKNYSSKISVMGWSMGAATSITAAAEDKDVCAVIADSPFSDLNDYLNAQLPVWSHVPPKWSHLPQAPFNKVILLATRILTGMNPSEVSPRKSITQIAPRPLLLIHSDDDNAISVKNSVELYSIYKKAAGSKAEFWNADGAGHVGTYGKSPDIYMSKVIDFLNRAYR